MQPPPDVHSKQRSAGTKAFLFADLRDYTSFVEREGDTAAAALLREYRTLVRREVTRHQGAEIKTEGDSFYVVFDVPSAALTCAVAILKRAGARAGRLRIGIGLHAGESVAYDGQFVGSAVNIASRLASVAGPGELVISDTFRGLVRTSQSIPFIDRGPLPLKGVAEPIRAWTVRWDPAAAVLPVAPVGAPPARGAPAARRVASVWAIALIAAVAAIGATLLFAPRGSPTTRPAEAASGSTLVVVAGLGTLGYSGDGGPAVAAQVDEPIALVFDVAGNLYLADSTHQIGTGGIYDSYSRIRRIDRNGTIRTIAGGGTTEFPFAGTGASARFHANAGLAIDRGGVLYISSGAVDGNVPSWVATIGRNGELRVIAGGPNGYGGDGGPAAGAQLRGPRALAVSGTGELYVADTGNERIRVITSDGSIDTIAGSGSRGSGGDGGPARAATLFAPLGLAFSGDGSLFIADTNNHRVRRIDNGGTIRTVAGNGSPGSSGDGGPATSAALNLPAGLAFDRAGNLYIADTGNDRIRKVAPDGTITTIAGGSEADRLLRPAAVAVDAEGILFIADTGHHRVVRLASR